MNPITAAIQAITTAIVSNGRGAITASVLSVVLLSMMTAVSFVYTSSQDASNITSGALGPISSDETTLISAGGATGTTAIPLSTAQPFYDIRLSGAKLDGVTDDTAAFNAAQALLGAAGGGTLWIAKPIIVCGAIIQFNNILISGPDEQKSYFKPTSTSCPKWLTLGDSSHHVTGINIKHMGFVQPAVGAQTAGTAVSFDFCFMCGVDYFFARNPWDLFTFNSGSGSIFIDHGQVRTVIDNAYTFNNVNDIYFHNIVEDYDTAGGNSNACFQINASAGSIVVSDSDFIHCGNALNVAPTGGAGVEWLFISNTAFDTCSGAGFGAGGTGILFNPTGSGAGGPSYIHGGKFTNVWSSGCFHGLVTSGDGVGFTEAMAFDNFTSQGNGQEGVLLGGLARSFSFLNPELFRNSSTGTGTFANIRLAGTGGVGNVNITGGKIGAITDTGGTTFSESAWGIKADNGYSGTLSVSGTDMCGNLTSGMNVNGNNISPTNPLPSNITVSNAVCSGVQQPTDQWATYSPSLSFTGGTTPSGVVQSGGFNLQGKAINLHTSIVINYGAAPTAMLVTLPLSSLFDGNQSCSGTNASTGAALSAYTSGTNTILITAAAGAGVFTTASGQTINLSCANLNIN